MHPRRLLSLWLTQDAPAELEPLALACQQFTPLTAIDPPDGILLDITGCAHLFGGEAGLLAALQKCFPGARTAIAPTATAAWGLARYAPPGATDILSLPLAALRLPERSIIRLRRVGIRRIGELQRLAAAELTAGFGPEPALQLARALGKAPEILRFITAPPDWREVEHYAEPIFAPAQLQSALARLAAKLCERLGDAQAGATELTAQFYRIDRARPEISLRFAAPCRDAVQISRLLAEQLAEKIDPGFGIEAIALHAESTESRPPEQSTMSEPAPDYSAPVNTLLNRLGGGNFWRAAPHASHIPEFASRRIAVNLPPVPWGRPRFPRPLRLLPRPDAITAIAPVPDDPPVFFTWRGQGHRIAHATGPERIARDWWCHMPDPARHEAERLRDYYEVEDSAGARFWVFRAGLKHPARWFLHGFF